MARPFTSAEFGGQNPNTLTKTDAQAEQAWNPLEILKAGDLNGFIAWCARYAISSSNEIANALSEFQVAPDATDQTQLGTIIKSISDIANNTASTAQLKSNIVQDFTSPNETTYPSSKAVNDVFSTINPSLYEVIANKVQNLDNSSDTTYPSTQAVKNESNRIINLINNKLNSIDVAPAYGSPIEVSLPFTAPQNGWILVGITRPSNGNYQGFVKVNGVTVCSYLSNYNTASGYGNTQIMVRAGDTVSTYQEVSVNYAIFIRLPNNKFPG